MNAEKKRETREFCLGRVDEAFAEIFFIFGGEFRAEREILPDASDVGAVFSPRAEDAGFGEAKDFDLSSRKRRGLEDSDRESVSELPSARVFRLRVPPKREGRLPMWTYRRQLPVVMI